MAAGNFILARPLKEDSRYGSVQVGIDIESLFRAGAEVGGYICKSNITTDFEERLVGVINRRSVWCSLHPRGENR